jgi:hypothetical protein
LFQQFGKASFQLLGLARFPPLAPVWFNHMGWPWKGWDRPGFNCSDWASVNHLDWLGFKFQPKLGNSDEAIKRCHEVNASSLHALISLPVLNASTPHSFNFLP